MYNSITKTGIYGRNQTKNTLEREGIQAASLQTISGSNFGKSQPTIHRARAQQSIDNRLPDRKLVSLASGEKKVSDIVDQGTSHHNFLSRTLWVNLGDGWFQTTPLGTGSTTRCGLHSVIESSLGQFFMCLYEPRSKEAISACTSSSPEYDLEVHTKVLAKLTPTLGGNVNGKRRTNGFQIVFGFRSATEYCCIKCDELNKCWQISHTTRGEERLLRQIPDDNIKLNAFYHLLIQIRGSNISVDINGTPIFTAIRISERDNLGGLMGLLSKGTKFAVKGWKLKGISSALNNNINRSVIPTTEVVSTEENIPINLFNNFQSVRSGISNPPTSSSISTNNTTTTTTTKKSISLMDALRAKSSTEPASNAYNTNNIIKSYTNKVVETDDTTSVSSDNKVYEINGNKTEKASDDCRDSANSNSDQLLNMCAKTLTQSHDRAIVDTVIRDVVQRDLGVTFDDIASLATAKRLLNEAIVLPLIMPEFFTGIREPWKGVLLFGPPGTGKTLLAKAVCSFNSSTFFSCSSSSLISKYRGESEKIVRCLFEAARLCAPSIVFLDEVDALVCSRGDNEHEASRRLKTEIFSQMDGLASTKSVGEANKSVMVLATTNCPWDLDEALRRRLEKRIYIPLPDLDARREIFAISLRDIPVSPEVSIATLAEMSDGYSGSDVYTACKDAAMMPMRRLLTMLSPAEIVDMRQRGDITVPRVTLEDFRQAILNTKPSVASGTIGRYVEWEKEFSNR